MKRLVYEVPHKLPLLHDELLGAGITPLYVEEDAQGNLVITVADDVQDSAVKAVVDDHDPSQPSMAEQLDGDVIAATAELVDGYQQAMTALTNTIDNGDTLTAAQVRSATVTQARLLRATLRVLRRTLI